MNLSNNDRFLDEEGLLKIFDYINERLKENLLKLEITIYGEMVMTILKSRIG